VQISRGFWQVSHGIYQVSGSILPRNEQNSAKLSFLPNLYEV
jgi:uncharacterized protein with LGFP repeats